MEVRLRSFDFGNPTVCRNRNLPHWEQPGVAYFVGFRLGDSLPKHFLQSWDSVRKHWLDLHPPPWSRAEQEEYNARFHARVERYLDAGQGSCVLRTPACADALEETMIRGNGSLYLLGSWVIMPNHVHALVVPCGGSSLRDTLGAWRSISARKINRLLGRTGRLWSTEAFDHIVRNAAELERIDAYIKRNPEKAGLPPGAYRLGGNVSDWTFRDPPAGPG